ncbi:unnamed protein product [Periconia digitata]|uniref:DUF7708 domain-containing protein n=1 Tax=Periconia digitata TaxID=1303443 RepID=A0A9W4U5T2_9PLEO|nr:unnamed protein product [Periconia digitata]
MLAPHASAARPTTTTSSWYLASSNPSVSAQTAFEKSFANFKLKLALHPKKRVWFNNSQATKLQDVLDEANKAQKNYDDKHRDSKLHKYILAFSKRVAYYGKVLDVMVQHHPEYVSLAWGALKFIFGVIIEHDKIGTTIVTALNDIGDALSRIDLAESMYPTEKMKETIVILNCHIMEFICRAIEWFDSSPWLRVIKSIAKPVALHYDDLIKDINRTIGTVTDLSVAGSQAEQRDMHLEMLREHQAEHDFRSVVQARLDEMQHQLNTVVQQKFSDGDLKAVYSKLHEVTALVQGLSKDQVSSEKTLLQELVVMKQDIQSTQADIRHQLSEVQLDQAISYMSTKCVIEHKVAYEHAILLRKVHRVSLDRCAPFWDSQQLQTWDRAPSHSSIVVSSTFRDRLNIRDFYVGVIEQLLDTRSPVLWIIQQKDKKGEKHNIFDILRSLIVQALNQARSTQTDVGISSRIRGLEAATSVSDYTWLLVDVLSQLQVVYIIVDVNAILPDSIQECREVFQNAVRLMEEHQKHTVLKTMFVGYVSLKDLLGKDRRQQAVVRVPETSKKKGKRVPHAPLKGKSKNIRNPR